MVRIGLLLFILIFFVKVDVSGNPGNYRKSKIPGIFRSGQEKQEQNKNSNYHGLVSPDDSIQFSYPMSTTVVKRKTPIMIRWKGIQPGTTYYLELFRNGIYQEQIAEIVDKNQFEWQVSKEYKGGKDYQFRLVNSRFFGDYSFSEKFQIKNRIPRAFWAVPAAVGAAGIYFLIKLIIDSGPGPEQPDLPAPIEPY
jgi:hypothetical protein